VADINKDGKLSYTEFKQAVANNQIFINEFWLNSSQLNLMNLSYNYYSNLNSNYVNNNYNNKFKPYVFDQGAPNFGGNLKLTRQDAKSPKFF
jgi:hypothetical protein